MVLKDKVDLAPLTNVEKLIPYSKYYYIPPARPPKEVLDAMGDNEPMDPGLAITPDRCSEVIFNKTMPTERGWCIMPDGTGYVVGTTPFKDVPPEALEWWFSWFPLDSLRAKIWCPEHHQGLVLPQPVKMHMLDYSLTNKQRAVGSYWYGLDTGMDGKGGIAVGPSKLGIVPDSQFGINTEEAEKDGTRFLCYEVFSLELHDIICSFMHVAHPTDYGFELRSHFWFGWKFVDGKPEKSSIKLSEDVLKVKGPNQNIHLIDEYYILANILPDLYREYGKVHDI